MSYNFWNRLSYTGRNVLYPHASNTLEIAVSVVVGVLSVRRTNAKLCNSVTVFVTINPQIIFSINHLCYKTLDNRENSLFQYPKTWSDAFNVYFCLTNIPKPKNIKRTLM